MTEAEVINEMMMLNEQEYRDMYAEYCMESGERMTDRGFTEFKAWRERVEDLFEKRAEST